jgi:hypothetical protein
LSFEDLFDLLERNAIFSPKIAAALSGSPLGAAMIIGAAPGPRARLAAPCAARLRDFMSATFSAIVVFSHSMTVAHKCANRMTLKNFSQQKSRRKFVPAA